MKWAPGKNAGILRGDIARGRRRRPTGDMGHDGACQEMTGHARK